ncbi:MAG: cryptochrome/photolyase family protein, partial [Aeromonadaceae bacterium]
ITTAAGTLFQVFTPFSRAWLARLSQQGFGMAAPIEPQNRPAMPNVEWRPISLNYPKLPCEGWPASEKAIRQRLWLFAQHKLTGYGEKRDFPALAATSEISPYLAMGALSVRQCLAAIEAALGQLPLAQGAPGFAWLNELIWREFYQHLMALEPRLAKGEPFKRQMAHLAWRQDEALFAAWCGGQTGYPIVDAAMRCLAQTGWLHNRLRMIVASFLCKDLQLPWWWGERYFMQQLLDGELAANNGGWQWSAGTGADAAPWFRIFNPTTQGQKFDPQGEFIRTYLPELAQVPLKQLHAPHAWLVAQGQADRYPAPIVDHAVARQITLSLFQAHSSQP